MRIQIVGNRLLIQPKQLQKKHTVEGTDIELEIAYGESEKSHETATTEGVVVGVGPQAYEEDSAPWCKEGDVVSWGKYTGYWITDPETKDDYVILHPHDILCVIQGEA